ncbi:MAG: hypothetical protein AB1344_03065 [Pseudomonadota bacterium]
MHETQKDEIIIRKPFHPVYWVLDKVWLPLVWHPKIFPNWFQNILLSIYVWPLKQCWHLGILPWRHLEPDIHYLKA